MKKTNATGYSSGWQDYKTGKVCLGYWEDGERQIDRFDVDWYFYFDRQGFKKLKKLAPQDVEQIRTEKEGEFVKCYFTSSWNERRSFLSYCEANGIATYEMDLNPFNRFLTDNEFQFEQNLRVLFFDFETDARLGFQNVGNHPILMVGYYSSVTKKYGYLLNKPRDYDDDYSVMASERELLNNFLQVIDDHDLLVAWNGDGYDEPVLRGRLEWHNLPRRGLKKINFIDQMQLFKKYYGRDASGSGIRTSFSLDNIANTVLNKGKLKGLTVGNDSPVKAILDAWQFDKQVLIDYCLRDVGLMVELDDKFGFIESQRVLANLCGRFLSSWSLKSGYLNDAFVLRYAKKKKIHFPTKLGTFYDENPFIDEEKIAGAYVMEPVVGVHDMVCDVDFASLYPNIIRSFNISPETRLEKSNGNNSVAANGAMFDMKKEGIFPQIVNEAMKLRGKFKRRVTDLESQGQEGSLEHTKAVQLSNAYKVLANTMYGILASKFLRYYDPKCGEAVTLTAKACTLLLIAKTNQMGVKTLYSDTDSVFLHGDIKQADKVIKQSADWMDEYIRSRGGEPGHIRLDLDAVYDRIIFIRKKGYFGIKSTGKIDVKGLEIVRSDGCKIGRDFQKRVVDYFLYVDKPKPAGVELLIAKWKTKIFENDVTIDDIKLTQSLNKSLDEYKVDGPHVRVARQMLKDGDEVYLSMKIPYFLSHTVKIKGEGKKQIVKHIKKFTGTYDAIGYWNKKVYPLVERIVEIVFPEIDWKVNRAKESSKQSSKQCSFIL